MATLPHMKTLTEIYKSLVMSSDGVDTDGPWPQQLAWHERVNNNDRLVITTFPGAGKMTFAAALVIDVLQRDPNKRVLVVTGSSNAKERIMRAVGDAFTEKSTGTNWLVVPRDQMMADASVTFVKPEWALVGNRFDLVVVDLSRTRFNQHRTDDEWLWFNTVVFGRLTQRSRVVALEYCLDESDLRARFLANDGYVGTTWAANEPGLAQWSAGRINHAQLRHDLGDDMYRRLYLCEETWRTSPPQAEQVVGGIDAPAD